MLTSAVLEARTGIAVGRTFASLDVSNRLSSPVESLFEQVSTANDNSRSVEQELSSRLAGAQRELSLVSMYLTPEFLEGTFRQLAQLVDPESWDEDDTYLDVQSFRSFARAMALLRPRIRPMLGLSARGNTLAMWASDTLRLSFEHLPRDEVKWFANSQIDEQQDRAAGMTHVSRIQRIVEAHSVGSLLRDEG